MSVVFCWLPKLTLCSDKQFRDRFRKWGLNTKNTKRQLKDHALAGLIDGVVRVSSNMVYLPDGAEIPMHKVMRHRADRLREARRAGKWVGQREGEIPPRC